MTCASELVADLHLHSTASDGEWDPPQLVEQAVRRGLQAIAITDHDTIAGLAAAQTAAAARLEVIPGCELTAYEDRIEYHILAYFFDTKPDSPLALLLQQASTQRWQRVFEMGQQLRAAGHPIEDEDIRAAAAQATSPGQPHVAAALVQRGHARSIGGAITRFLRQGKVGYVPKKKLSPGEVLQAVHASGGIAILAHPGSAPHDERIPSLIRLGLDGLEAWHHTHTPVNRRFYAGLARRYEVGISGGSDFHGPRVKPGVQVGDSGVTRPVLAELRQRARQRAGG